MASRFLELAAHPKRRAMERAVTPEQIQRVRGSFAKMAGSPGQAAALFYRRLFELEPALRPLFTGDMKAQGVRLMASLRDMVGALDQPERVLPAVRELGRRHAAYGVRPEHYATVGEALIWALEQGLGAAFTRDTRRAWIDAYAGLAWPMIAAAEEDEGLAQTA
jgi:hemoglobin-like flavoprotein